MSNQLMYDMYLERYNRQPQEIKDKLDGLKGCLPQLKTIKRTRPKLQVGDVFVLSPRENIYFYGKILKTNIKTIGGDGFIDGQQTVFIHKCKTDHIGMNGFRPDYENLLIRPCIVHKSYWTQGYFFNVGHEELTEAEKTLDYGFYNSDVLGRRGEWFCTEEKQKLERTPKIIGLYGITTIIGVAWDVEKELIMDSSLLD